MSSNNRYLYLRCDVAAGSGRIVTEHRQGSRARVAQLQTFVPVTELTNEQHQPPKISCSTNQNTIGIPLCISLASA